MGVERASEKLYRRNFTRNMVLIVIFVSFVPMLLVSGMILHQYRLSYNEKLYAHLREVVYRHTQDIDTFLNERLNNLQFLLDSCHDENLLDETVLQEKLFQLQQKYEGDFEDLGLINEKGVQEVYAGRFSLEKAEYSDARWFQEALTKPYYISDVFQGLRSRSHFIVSVKTVHQGRPFLLRSTINFEVFNSLAENLRIGKTGFAFILNRNGDFQTKPHYDMVPNKKSYMDFIKAGKKATHGIYMGEIQDASGSNPAIYLAALLKNDDWILVFQQEKKEAFSDLIQTQIVAVVILLFGAFLIVVMNLILFHKVISHISEVDREKEMMNRQVVETGKLASVGRLAAGTAHEINNPVAIMVQEAGWIDDLLKEEEFQDRENLQEIKRALKQIGVQGKRCKEITHKLLSFARTSDSQIQNLQINEMIREVVAISDKTSYTGITINTHLDESIPVIYGSQTEIQQVLLNLINNALYALEKDGGNIDIATHLAGRNVMVIVEDDGPGIPKANLDRIFDPFFTTKPVGEGNGLGLSICFGIIQRMGGSITVHSTVDVGTRFEILLPLKKPAALSDDTALASGE
ncbi:MAG: two-component sensor histidine kinase [Deltaproteobacteria bacterium]|jgi:two-component system NtrC family sensor kinase|nr:two-component sensor histidine kinase [Deltaproteobacteria bacterium]